MRMMMTIGLMVGWLITAGCGRDDAATPSASARGEVRIAAAADLKFAFEEAIEAFGRKYPHIVVRVSYGSSGSFYAQLRNRSPFDVYFSADIDYPRNLVQEGLADPDSQFPYAIGRVVIWVPNDSPIDVVELGMEALLHPRARKIALGNPHHAPYGRAAEQAMRHVGIYEQVKEKFVLGENIAQAAQFVQSRAADVGIIALSLAMAPPMTESGRYWLIPAEYHAPLKQGAVIMNWAKDRAAAEAFCRFLREPAGRAIMEKYGFIVPTDPFGTEN